METKKKNQVDRPTGGFIISVGRGALFTTAKRKKKRKKKKATAPTAEQRPPPTDASGRAADRCGRFGRSSINCGVHSDHARFFLCILTVFLCDVSVGPPLCTPFHQLVPLWLDFRGIWSVPSTIWPKSKFIGQNLGKFHFEVNFHQPPPSHVVSSASAVRYFSWNLIVQSPDASATFSSFSVVQWNPPITMFQVNNPLRP